MNVKTANGADGRVGRDRPGSATARGRGDETKPPDGIPVPQAPPERLAAPDGDRVSSEIPPGAPAGASPRRPRPAQDAG